MVVNVLSLFCLRSQAEEKILKNKNIQIFYCLQILLARISLLKLNLTDHAFDFSPLY